jgi:ABC-type transport system involved in Fe-S cluster assembly fused permease/ATPase subunit
MAMSLSDKNPLEELTNSFYKAAKGVEVISIATFYAAAGIILSLFAYLIVFPWIVAGWKVALTTVLVIWVYLIYCVATWDGK